MYNKIKIENTYAWINETPISIVINIICIIDLMIIIFIFIEIIIVPINDNKRCPAIMLAVNRNVNANGRIIFLNNSIITIIFISIIGVPTGTK